MPTDELPEDSTSTPRLAGAKKGSCTLIRSGRKERRWPLDPGQDARSGAVATKPKERDTVRITIRCSQRGASKDTAIGSGGAAPEPAPSCHARNGQLLIGRQPDACIIEDLNCALRLTRVGPRTDDRHEPTP